MPDNAGYSYSAYFLSQWTILWDQYNRQRLPYFYCCFDFDRSTYEMFPDEKWVNSTGYLRAMMQGFFFWFYAYTGDPRTLEFLQNFMDYELEHGTTPEDYVWAECHILRKSRGEKLHRLESARRRLCGAACGRRRRLRVFAPVRNDWQDQIFAGSHSLRESSGTKFYARK
jgi:hypothetical protein